ncbi:hypothetical protein PSPO01_07121 [Paraphaeosphaeria sporulosa]
MSAFAVAMLVVVATHAQAFGNRINKFTSSVGGDHQVCHAATRTNNAILLVVDAAATTVLGMSNTYQQIITSLQASDMRYMLKKFGSSRLGTNSPWNINRSKNKKKGGGGHPGRVVVACLHIAAYPFPRELVHWAILRR